MARIGLSCTCGTLTGQLSHAKGAGTHCVCFCRSCRSAQIVLGQPDPHPEPVPLYQTTPDRISIDTGADQLAVLRLSPATKTYRWYAACCNAPLAITGAGPGISFVSLCVDRLADAAPLGRVRCKAFVPQPDGTTKHTNLPAFAYGLISRAIAARMSGRWQDTPFFDPVTKEPKGPVRILTPEDRAALPLKG